MQPHERQALAYTSTAHFLSHVVELTFAAVLVLVGVQFGLKKDVLGAIATAAALAFGTSALPAGFLVDRIGSRRVLIVTMLASAACSLLVAFSNSVAMFAVTLTALGLAIGLYHPAGLSLISREVEKRALGMGLHGMAGNLGVALTPLLAGNLAAFWGWRAPFFLLAALTLLLGAVVLLAPFRERGLPHAPAAGTQAAPEAARWHHLLAPLLLVYVATMVGGFIYRGTLTFLPAHFQEHVRLNIGGLQGVALAGDLATIALLFGVAGQYVGGNLALKYRLEKLALVLTLILVPALVLVGLTTGVALVVAAAAFALFNFMAQPVWNTLVAEYTPPALQGRAFGLNFFATFGLGSFAAGFSGLVAERLGVQWVFVVLGGLAFLISLLALVLLRRAANRRLPVPAPASAATGGSGPQPR